ncbi:DUF4214 domain-containing protein [Cellulomonas sp.]|uniref:DUF4214 domain-containing protein n=1 Tax=Cellulomonas sp. TaxID=40001 RepID=UPI003BA855DE
MSVLTLPSRLGLPAAALVAAGAVALIGAVPTSAGATAPSTAQSAVGLVVPVGTLSVGWTFNGSGYWLTATSNTVDVAQWTYQLEGGPVSTVLGTDARHMTAYLGIPSDGTYDATIWARNAGGELLGTATVVVTVATPEGFVEHLDSGGGFYDGAVEFGFGANYSDVARWTYQIDAGPGVEFAATDARNATVRLTSPPAGDHTLTVRAWDDAGALVGIGAWDFDTEVPPAGAEVLHSWYSNWPDDHHYELGYTALHSDVAQWSYQLDGGPVTVFPGSALREAVLKLALADGDHTVVVRARDGGGSIVGVKTWSLAVGTPWIGVSILDSGGGAAENGWEFGFEANNADIAHWSYQLDDGAVTAMEATDARHAGVVLPDVEAGEHTLFAWARTARGELVGISGWNFTAGAPAPLLVALGYGGGPITCVGGRLVGAEFGWGYDSILGAPGTPEQQEQQSRDGIESVSLTQGGHPVTGVHDLAAGDLVVKVVVRDGYQYDPSRLGATTTVNGNVVTIVWSIPPYAGQCAPVVVPTPPAPVLDPVQAYVTKVYSDLFGRTPDPVGLTSWSASLRTGTPYGQVANGITYSDEYRGRMIAEAYATYLDRAPDPAGAASWLSAMRSGLHIEQMQAGFISSPEYYARGGGTDTGWIVRLYGKVLGRAPAASEIAFWQGRLNAGASRESVARGFLYSDEHLTSVVDGYYGKLLRRSIDATGRQTWVSAIQRGARDEEIIASIVASAEYRSKV